MKKGGLEVLHSFHYGWAFFFLAILFLCVHSWAVQTECEIYTREGNWSNSTCNNTQWIVNNASPIGCQSYGQPCGTGQYDKCCNLESCTGAFPVIMKFLVCPNQCALDKYQCDQDSTKIWVPAESSSQCGHCDTIPSAKTQCERDGGTWVETNGGYCVPNCRNASCCDSLARNLPTETYEDWLGCITTAEHQGCSTVGGSGGNATAECDGVSLYDVCTIEWIWNGSASQCAPVPNRNCVQVTRYDDKCAMGVYCKAVTRQSIGGSTYNSKTGCYETKVQDITYLECTNGIRDQQQNGPWYYTNVCNSWLDSNNTNISNWLTNGNGSGGGGGGSGGGGNYGGCVGNGCPGDALAEGGWSVNDEGDSVWNDPALNINDYSYQIETPVVNVDTNTGMVTIVKNQYGQDSTVTTTMTSGVKCLGVSNGVATISDGFSTYTVQGVQSCSQAELKWTFGGGGGGSGGGSPYNSSGKTDKGNNVFNPTYGDSIVYIAKESAGDTIGAIDYSIPIANIARAVDGLYNYFVFPYEYLNFADAVNAVVTSINSGTERGIMNRDSIARVQESLWKQTFGDSLSFIRDQNLSIVGISTKIDTVTMAINSASSANVFAVNNAASAIETKLDAINASIHQGFSANSNAIASAASFIVNENNFAISVMREEYSDSVHQTNTMLESIFSALDSGGIVNRDINAVRHSVDSLPFSMDTLFSVSIDNWFNDRLKITLDSNASLQRDSIHNTNKLLEDLKSSMDHMGDSINIDIGDDLGRDIAGAIDSTWSNAEPLSASGFEEYVSDSSRYASVLDSLYDEGISVDSAFNVGTDTCSTVDCMIHNTGYNVDSAGQALKRSLDTSYQALSDSSLVWMDSLRKNLMFIDFDSLIAPIRTKIPNTNSCPDQCFTFDINGNVIPGVSKISYPICKNFTIGGISTNALLIVRLILRILTAFACIYIGLWYISGRKG